jgi:hypothetical protein
MNMKSTRNLLEVLTALLSTREEAYKASKEGRSCDAKSAQLLFEERCSAFETAMDAYLAEWMQQREQDGWTPGRQS